MRTRLAAIGLATMLASLLGAAAPVYASKPIVAFDRDRESTVELIDCATVDAAFDFVVLNHAFVQERQLLWGDPSMPDRALYQAQGTDNLFRDVAPGIVLSGKYRFSSHLTIDWSVFPPFAEQRNTGIFWNIHLPGQGNVYKEAGLIVDLPPGPGLPGPVVKRAGLTDKDELAVCGALAG